MKVTFDLPIPTKVEKFFKYEFKTRKARFIRKLFPYKCSRCKDKVYFKTPQYFVNGAGNLGVAFKYIAPTCRKCSIVDVLSTWDAMAAAEGYPESSCGVCSATNVKTVRHSFIGCGIHFCRTSWNSTSVCLDCAIDVLQYGKTTGGVQAYFRKKLYHLSGGAIVTEKERLV